MRCFSITETNSKGHILKSQEILAVCTHPCASQDGREGEVRWGRGTKEFICCIVTNDVEASLLPAEFSQPSCYSRLFTFLVFLWKGRRKKYNYASHFYLLPRFAKLNHALPASSILRPLHVMTSTTVLTT